MTEEEKKLFELFSRKPDTPETLPFSLGLRQQIKDKDQKVYDNIARYLPNISAYLGLQGSLLGGEYNITPNQLKAGEIPVKIDYKYPLYGGILDAAANFTPGNNSFMINYNKRF